MNLLNLLDLYFFLKVLKLQIWMNLFVYKIVTLSVCLFFQLSISSIKLTCCMEP